MNPKRVRLRLFEGEGYQVEHDIVVYLHSVSVENLELVDVKYNY
ncbi:hypothetical protein LCGC14_2501570 [marine sediment metagenome]|uniref:Uncharacterized protein n=1 Tax=marine sediment metagenome TaxID=412755 RepID=A0A0F9DDH7_9ZZZZ